MKASRLLVLLAAAGAAAAGLASSARAQTMTIDWHTVDGGGATSLSGSSPSGVYTLAGTAGQPDASAAQTTDAITLIGGFWPLVNLHGFYFTVTPCRVYDSRTGAPLANGVDRLVVIGGNCGIPVAATAVAVNITAIAPTGGGRLTVWPADQAIPGTSTLNFSAGETRSNNAIVVLSVDASAAVLVRPFVIGNGSVHVTVDVVGYFK